jgi:hypothetical protein
MPSNTSFYDHSMLSKRFNGPTVPSFSPLAGNLGSLGSNGTNPWSSDKMYLNGQNGDAQNQVQLKLALNV